MACGIIMSLTSTLTNYDVNAADFDRFRQPNPITVKELMSGFRLAGGPILSLGCGTGQYENILSKTFKIFGIMLL